MEERELPNGRYDDAIFFSEEINTEEWDYIFVGCTIKPPTMWRFGRDLLFPRVKAMGFVRWKGKSV